ncbi:MAG: ABC transporter substrate-binding protein [Deltaproteobacteria bacterium]|jgi:NitT/TauT family transport system substrate-binding protein|nr:ABC transporter substrate-binding protein [Deltaproteobacteria bacterium]
MPKILVYALALVLAFILVPGSTNAEEVKKLRVGINGNLCEGPTHIALEKGFFQAEGLDAELIRLAPGTNFEAITAGSVDVSFGLLATLIQPLSNGLPIKITTGLHTGCDKLLVKPDSGITSLKDLKGKKIGVPSLTSSPIMFARRGLAQAGVKVGDKDSEVEFVVFTNAELPLALSKGAIDALAANDPVASLAAREYKFSIILDSAKDAPFSNQYCCAAYVSEALAKNDPETAAKYTRAMQKAAAWIQKNPDETAKIQVEKKYVAGDPIFNASVLKTFRYIPSVSGAVSAFGITARELKEIGILGPRVDVDALHKNSFVTLPNVPDSVE